MTTRPFDGLRVLDFTWVLIGPQTGEYLATFGADVIRVESAVQPDIVRRIPTYYKDGVPGINRSGVFNAINRGKRSIRLNLGDPRGVELARSLVREWRPDILLENAVPGTMQRRGLAYEDLAPLKPDLIYCSMSLLGQTGPSGWYRGWGPNLQCRTGISWLSGHPEYGEPAALGGTYPDYGLAGYVMFAVLSSLWHRNRTGEGQHIDFAQNEAVINALADAMMEYTMNGRDEFMRGNRDPRFVPQGVYRCAGPDDWVAISIADDREFRTLCEVMGAPEPAGDPRFEDVRARSAHHDELDAVITDWTKQRTNIEVQDILQAAGIAAGAAIDSEQLLADPHLQARGFFLEIDHDEVGPATYGGWPVHFSDSAPDVRKAPLFGQHNEEVYRGILGMAQDDLASLIGEEVVY